MKNCCSWLPEAVAIAGVVIGVGVAFQGWPSWPQADGQALAAWVQAVGSVAAIAAAIWIAHDQHAKAEKRSEKAEKDEVRNFLLGVREELNASLMIYMAQAGTDLAKTSAGEVVDFWWPAPPEPFKVYSATVGMIGRVRDDEIRQQIIATYVVTGGLLLTWETHNRLLTEFNEANEALLLSTDDAVVGRRRVARVEKMFSILKDYSDQLRVHHLQAVALIEATIKAIDRRVDRSSN
jgi:hypothetical protein